MNENKKRSKVAILLNSEPTFNEYAFKYFILNLNSIQSNYEFVFPEFDEYYFVDKLYNEATLLETHKKGIKEINFESKPDYYVNIIESEIEGNLFFICIGNASFITTNSWQKYFSPPSLFEYLLHGISVSLIAMHPKIGLVTHTETRGCTLDYTKYKADRRVDVSLGYLCDDCKKIISQNAGKEYLEDMYKIINRVWIGDINSFSSVAYNLKHFFKFDINKDSGFNKNFWEKAKEYFPELPKEIVAYLISSIIGGLLGAGIALLLSKP